METVPSQNSALVVRDPVWEKTIATIPEALIHPKDRPRLLLTLEGIASDKKWCEIAPNGLSRPEYMMLKRRSPEFLKLARAAEQIADDIRQSIREDEAHHRAVDGETIPVYTVKGNLAGTYQKRSDKLMEVMLKASDPARYRDSKSDAGQGGKVVLQVNFGIPSRVAKTVNMEEIEDAKEIEGTEESRSPGENGAGSTGHIRQPGTADQGDPPGGFADGTPDHSIPAPPANLPP